MGFETISYTYSLVVHKKKVMFSMWDLKHFSICTLYSQEKSYIFSMWDKNFFGLNTSI
jgi:hypothetical protein